MPGIQHTDQVLIAVPAFNEEKGISMLLEGLESWKKQVLVVDDGSTDNTAKIASGKGYTCISVESNQGLAMFYRIAKTYASDNGYTHLLSIDADGQHDTRYIPEFIEKLTRYDLVSGNRFHNTSGISERKISSNLFAILLFREFLGIPLPDAACGFMGMKLDVIPDDHRISRFEIIYELRARHVLAGREIGFVRIPAIYHTDDPLDTNISEIKGLIRTVSRHHPAQELNRILNSLDSKSDFNIRLSGFQFESVFRGHDAYHFRTELAHAKEYFRSINSNHNQED